MTRYELLKANEDTMYQFIKAGILSFQVIRDIEIFERYQELEGLLNQEAKYMILSDEYELSIKRIQQLVLNMQK
jgi:hypothetical protein